MIDIEIHKLITGVSLSTEISPIIERIIAINTTVISNLNYKLG
jgi:hypothetical protein